MSRSALASSSSWPTMYLMVKVRRGQKVEVRVNKSLRKISVSNICVATFSRNGNTSAPGQVRRARDADPVDQSSPTAHQRSRLASILLILPSGVHDAGHVPAVQRVQRAPRKRGIKHQQGRGRHDDADEHDADPHPEQIVERAAFAPSSARTGSSPNPRSAPLVMGCDPFPAAAARRHRLRSLPPGNILDRSARRGRLARLRRCRELGRVAARAEQDPHARGMAGAGR